MSDPSAYRAATESAAFFDLTGWTSLHLFGRDALSFFHNFCTNEIKNLPPGRACEAFVTNVKARVLGHVFAFRWPEIVTDADAGPDEPSLLLQGAPGQGEKLAAHLDRYLIREQVTIADETPYEWATYVCGPEAAARVDAAVRLQDGGFRGGPDAPAELAPYATTTAVFDASPTMICRLDLLGRPGFLILHHGRGRTIVADRLASAGASPAGPDVFDALRIEACFPLYGVDVTEDHLAPEVGRSWAISYTKGCYLGQEPIARIDALGHVNRLLRGLRLESGPAPDCGAAVLAEGKEIGTVTSATTSFADGRPVALGYLRTTFAGPGTAVTVRTLAGDVPATVYGPPGA